MKRNNNAREILLRGKSQTPFKMKKENTTDADAIDNFGWQLIQLRVVYA